MWIDLVRAAHVGERPEVMDLNEMRGLRAVHIREAHFAHGALQAMMTDACSADGWIALEFVDHDTPHGAFDAVLRRHFVWESGNGGRQALIPQLLKVPDAIIRDSDAGALDAPPEARERGSLELFP